jgi:hypothetical protein
MCQSPPRNFLHSSVLLCLGTSTTRQVTVVAFVPLEHLLRLLTNFQPISMLTLSCYLLLAVLYSTILNITQTISTKLGTIQRLLCWHTVLLPYLCSLCLLAPMALPLHLLHYLHFHFFPFHLLCQPATIHITPEHTIISPFMPTLSLQLPRMHHSLSLKLPRLHHFMLSLSLWLLLIPSKPFTTPLTTLVLLLSMLIVILSYCTLPALLGTSRSSSLRIPCTLASIILTTDMCNSPPQFSTFFFFSSRRSHCSFHPYDIPFSSVLHSFTVQTRGGCQDSRLPESRLPLSRIVFCASEHLEGSSSCPSFLSC